eukprot:TRINITY_DN4836_c0_g2_i1.p1 TRINITY_DN4836_c0_g2~~TRINITY_DN4836_c0_g2_i1.p1  ORF type:complete len:213 (+),score=77.53 TRINITY_DN4836_c0_g2_i1:109-747(+)
MSDDELPNDDFLVEKKDTNKRKSEKPVKERKAQIKFDSAKLTNISTGIKKLYMKTKDLKSTGNPVKDLGNLMAIYQSWHYSLMPKIEFKYFLERVGKLGKETAVKVYMGRLRQVYKELLDFASFEEPGAEPKAPEAEPQEQIEEVKKSHAVPLQSKEDIELENAIQANEELDEVYLDQDYYLAEKESKRDLRRKRSEDGSAVQEDAVKYKPA